jgi:hypothetical protein
MLRPVVGEYLAVRSRRNETPIPPAVGPAVIWNTAVSKAVVDAFPSKQGQPVTEDKPEDAFAVVASATDKALLGLAENQQAIAQWAAAEVGRVTEQIGILTWLLSGVRADGTPWSALPPPKLAIDAGLELAARLARVPGPPEAEALLSQVIGFAERDDKAPKTTITEATKGTTSPIRAIPDQLADLAPIHASRSGRVLSTDLGTRQWSAVDLGRSAYFEATMITAWSRCNNDGT